MEKAKKLLKEAGWEDTDGDGILDKDGKEFEFSMLTNMGNRSREQTATIIQYRLKKIGIKMNIRVLEWSTFINEFIDKSDVLKIVILGWSLSGFRPSTRMRYGIQARHVRRNLILSHTVIPKSTSCLKKDGVLLI